MKRKSKILFALLAVALLVCIATVSLAACNKHKHIYSYDYDEEYHWQVCLDCGETTEKEAHVVEEWVTTKPATYDEDGEAKGECTVCGKTVQKTLTKLPLSPTDQESEKLFDLEYHKKDGNNPAYYSIGEYKGTATEVVIPSTYKDVPITEISFGYSSWNNVKSLAVEDDNPTFQSYMGVLYKKGETPSFYFAPKALEGEVNILDGVTEIPSAAFSGRVNVTEITIPDSVTSIGSSAFYDCDSIKELTVPKNVTSVGKLAFGEMDNLMHITWDAANCEITTTTSYSTKYGVFYGSAANIARVNRMNGVWVTIGDNCEKIDDYTFAGLDIDTIFIGSNPALKSIGEYAFAYCDTLRSIPRLTNDVTVAETALYGSTTVMYKLQDLDPSKLHYDVGEEGLVFYEESRNNFTLVDYNLNGIFNVLNLPKQIRINMVTYDHYKIGKYAFAYRKDPIVTIPSSVTDIDSTAFEGFSGTKINLDDNTRVEEQDNIVYKFVDDVPSILYVPVNISGDVKILNGVTEIPQEAFSSCKDMKSITIPNSVTSIGQQAFDGCTGLKSFEVAEGNSVYQSKDGILYKKEDKSIYLVPKAIEGAVTILDGCTSIGWNTFRDCTGLTEITIPGSVTSIGNAFDGCTGLTKVNVTSLKSWCEIEFTSNPLSAADNVKLYVKDVEVKDNVDIPTGTTKIGNYAFYKLTGITSVNIPDSVQSIGVCAFLGCTGLQTVNWNATNCTVAEGSYSYYKIFEGCTQLATVNFGGNVQTIPAYAFEDCTGLTKITIPNSVTSIGDYAFYGCAGLQTVTIGDGVTRIGKCAFYNCTGLQTATINAQSIGEKSFSGCTGLKDITISESVQTIGKNAFDGCIGITKVNYLGNLKSWCEIKSEATPLNGTAKLYVKDNGVEKEVAGDVKIPAGTTMIGSYAFHGLTDITSVIMPDSVTSIGERAFLGCTGLKSFEVAEGNSVYQSKDGILYLKEDKSISLVPKAIEGAVTILDGCTSISAFAFDGCTGLQTVTIGKGVTSIGPFAFEDCTGLTEITIPDTVNMIEYCAFDGCTGLTEITISDSVTSIGFQAFDETPWYDALPNGVVYIGKVLYKYKGEMPESTTINIKNGTVSISTYAFDGCTGLTEITIPNSVTSIDGYAFSGCAGLQTVTIGDGVTSIGPYAFLECTGLQTVTIGEGVQSIGDYAFLECTGLQTVNWNATNCTTVGRDLYSIFEYCTQLATVNFGGNVQTIPAYAFRGYTGITSVTIPDSVTSIGSQAFRNCTGLQTVYYEGTSEQWNSISIGKYNDELENAKRYYFSEQPNYDGNHWHWDEETHTPKVWAKQD